MNLCLCFSVSPERIEHSYGIENIQLVCASGMQHTYRRTEMTPPFFAQQFRTGKWLILSMGYIVLTNLFVIQSRQTVQVSVYEFLQLATCSVLLLCCLPQLKIRRGSKQINMEELKEMGQTGKWNYNRTKIPAMSISYFYFHKLIPSMFCQVFTLLCLGHQLGGEGRRGEMAGVANPRKQADQGSRCLHHNHHTKCLAVSAALHS